MKKLQLDMLNTFNIELNVFTNEITEKEVKIILALSDLLDEQINYGNNFVSDSLSYLKTHYGLTKNVWLVLLQLNDQILNFTDILSDWIEPDFLVSYKKNSLNEHYKLIMTTPIQHYGSNSNLREYNIKKLFQLIDELSKNFSIEESCNFVGLFIKQFDNRKSPYSINNLFELQKQIKNGQIEGEMTDFQVNLFFYDYIQQEKIYFTLCKLHSVYLDLNTDEKITRNYNLLTHSEQTLQFIFKNLGISCIDGNAIKLLNSIVLIYNKYTNEPFMTYQGLSDIKGHKNILPDDQKIIEHLLTEFDKTHHYNEIKLKTTIGIIQHLKNYTDVFKGMDKINILYDYIFSEHFHKQISQPIDFKFKDVLTWSNHWHIHGDSRGEKENFKKYNIDLQLNNYLFEQIIDSHQLHEEGKTQSHCVHTYKRDCLSGNTIIISMKNLEGKRISTIRLTKQKKILEWFKNDPQWTIAENRKKFNKACSKEEKEIAIEYFNLIKDEIISIE